MRYLFADNEFDTEAFELRRDGASVHTTPQVLSILQFLLVSRSRLVTKDELVDEIWGGRAISDAAITVRIRAVREAIGDNGKDQRLIKTVRGVGFRFVGDVRTKSATEPSDIKVDLSSDLPEQPGIDQRPSIAVLPFLFAGDRKDMAFLRYAIPDEVLTELCKARWLMVISRGSSFQLESHQTRPGEILERLNARYCVSGTIEATANGLIVSTELAETAGESVIWRERRRIDLQEVQELRTELVQSICLQLEHSIEQREFSSAQAASPSSLDSWQSFHIGMHHLNLSPVGHNHEAEACFKRSLEIEPTMARARAGLSQVQFFQLHWGNSQEPKKIVEACAETAKHALIDDPYDPFCNLAMARSGSLTRDYAVWRSHIEKAVNLSPSYSVAVADLARLQSVMGEIEQAKVTLSLAERLDPIALNPETTELTRLIIEMEAYDMEAAGTRAARMAEHGRLGLNTFACVLLALHLAGRTEDSRLAAEKMKRHFLPARLADWFSRTNFRNQDWAEATKSSAIAYGLV